MRVAWVDNAIEWGGVQEHLVFLSRLACAEGVEGIILCDHRLADRYRACLAGFPVEIASAACHRILSGAAWIGAYRALRDFRPEVVHAHLYWSTRLAAPLARLVGARRMVETVHLEEGWRSGWRVALDWLDRAIGRIFVHRHIAVSRAVARSLVDIRGVRPAKIATIHNAVPAEKRSDVGFRPGRSLAFLGRLEPQKGLDVLLHALALLDRRGVDFHLAVGGEGSQRQALEELARTLEIAERVSFVGKVTDRAAFFSDRSILVLPSRYEGLPLVLLEAGGQGLCVVASAVSGIPEIIEDDRTGLLVPKEDPEALATALGRAIEEEPLRERLSRSLSQKVATEFSPRSFLQRTLEVLA